MNQSNQQSYLKPSLPTAMLLLADGTYFRGYSFGATGDHRKLNLKVSQLGELVFNTAMTGYQEILTDPSYCGQIVAMTYPLIGNYGVNEQDVESSGIHAAGFVVQEFTDVPSNWRASGSLPEYLQKNNIPAICGIDIRSLTRHIRTKGSMNAYILSPAPTSESEISNVLKKLEQEPPFGEKDLTAVVSCKEAYEWTEPLTEMNARWRSAPAAKAKNSPLVVVIDFGCKFNSLRNFAARGCKVKVVPANASAQEILSLKPNAVFLSNGPGDPAKVQTATETVKELLGKLPIMGICMGHQILASAIGAKTFKLKFGHHGANQPVYDKENDRVVISSQNHGYAVDPQSLPNNCKVTQVHLNDETVAGIALPELNAVSVQYHPEAAPGPRDAEDFFDDFVAQL